MNIVYEFTTLFRPKNSEISLNFLTQCIRRAYSVIRRNATRLGLNDTLFSLSLCLFLSLTNFSAVVIHPFVQFYKMGNWFIIPLQTNKLTRHKMPNQNAGIHTPTHTHIHIQKNYVHKCSVNCCMINAHTICMHMNGMHTSMETAIFPSPTNRQTIGILDLNSNNFYLLLNRLACLALFCSHYYNYL